MYYNGCFFTKNPSQALSGKNCLAGRNAQRIPARRGLNRMWQPKMLLVVEAVTN